MSSAEHLTARYDAWHDDALVRMTEAHSRMMAGADANREAVKRGRHRFTHTEQVPA